MRFRYGHGLPRASLRAALFLLWMVPVLTDYIPLLFPSPIDTSGKLFNDVTGKLLPVEASFAESVCVTDDEKVRLGGAKQELEKCGTFVLFTNSSEASFTVMDLFDDGRVIRKIREPEFNVTVLGTNGGGGVVVAPRFLVVQRETGETVDFTDGTNYQLTNLPLDKIVRFEVSEFNQSTRHIFISRSSPSSLKPPTAKITRIRTNDQPENEGFKEFHVTFSDWVILNKPPSTDIPCSHELEQHFVERDGGIAINNTLLDVECPQANLADFSESTLRQMVEVLGAGNVSLSYRAPPFDVTKRGTPTIVVRVQTQVDNGLPQVNSTIPLSIMVPKGRVVSFGGAVNKRSFVYTDAVFSQKDIEKASDLATGLSVVAGAGVTTAVTTSVGVAVASASTGTVAGTAAGGSMAGASGILNEAQKIFLIGQIALAKLPETCEALSDGLEWTMLNMKLPWEKEGDEEEDRRIEIKRTLFWASLILVGLFLAHCLLLIFLLKLRIGIPTMLRLPRLELSFGYWAIPALATTSAGLFKDDGSKSDDEHRDDIILGVFLLLIFPGTFIVLHVYTLWSFFYRRSPQSYKAIAVFENEKADFELEALRSRLHSAISDIETSLIENRLSATGARNPNVRDEPVTQPSGTHHRTDESVVVADPKSEEEKQSGCGAFWEKFVLTPLLGPPYSVAWIAPAGPKNLFYARFGGMFEEFRGKPMGIRGNTYGVDENTQTVDRGIPTPVKVSRSVFSSSLEGSAIGHHLQVSGKVFDMFKLVFIATLISGEDDPETVAQVIVILTLTVIFFISLRVFRTPASRWDLGMAMFGEFTDIVTFTIALIIFTADLGRDAERTIGWVMMVTKSLSFMSTMLDHFFTIIDTVKGIIAAIKEKLGINPKLLEVVTSLQVYNPRYLERKFFNRWVRNSIGKGIQAAPLKRGVAPFEEVVYFRLFGGGRPGEEWKRDDARRPESKDARERRERILRRAKEESRMIIRNATERARSRTALEVPPPIPTDPGSMPEIVEQPSPASPFEEAGSSPAATSANAMAQALSTGVIQPESPTRETAAATAPTPSPPQGSSPFSLAFDEDRSPWDAPEQATQATSPEPSAPTLAGVGSGQAWQVVSDGRPESPTVAVVGSEVATDERPAERRPRERRPASPTLAGVGSGDAWQVASDDRPDREKDSNSIARFFHRVLSYTSR